jgi:hypothetical protein
MLKEYNPICVQGIKTIRTSHEACSKRYGTVYPSIFCSFPSRSGFHSGPTVVLSQKRYINSKQSAHYAHRRHWNSIWLVILFAKVKPKVSSGNDLVVGNCIGGHEHSALVLARAREYKQSHIFHVSLRVCSGPQQTRRIARITCANGSRNSDTLANIKPGSLSTTEPCSTAPSNHNTATTNR